MANTKKSNNQLARFNVQNFKYAKYDPDSGKYDAPTLYGEGMAKTIAIEPDSSTKSIFGDGRRICHLIHDKGKTVNITTNNISDDFEIEMGRKIRVGSTLANIRKTKYVPFAFYFETSGVDKKGGMPLAKTWVYGVHSVTPPSEDYQQTTDEINESEFETAMTADGTVLKNAAGTNFKDENGNHVIVWKMTAVPGDEGYDTFGDEVVLPVMPATGGTDTGATEAKS